MLGKGGHDVFDYLLPQLFRRQFTSIRLHASCPRPVHELQIGSAPGLPEDNGPLLQDPAAKWKAAAHEHVRQAVVLRSRTPNARERALRPTLACGSGGLDGFRSKFGSLERTIEQVTLI
jgi:hypothetical protein